MGWMWSSSPSSSGNAPSSANDNKDKPSTSTSTTTSKPSESEYGDPEIAKFMAQIQAEFGGGSNSKPASAPSSQPTPPATQETTPKDAPSPSSSSPPSSWSSWLPWGSSSSTPSSDSSPATSSRTIATPSPPTQVQVDENGTPLLDPLSESLLPTTMSCRQAFDHAFYCNSAGGQWTSVYREGTMRSCSEQWDDFWFCMRTRAYTGTIKEEAIRAHYRKKERARYYTPGKPASTDVWEARREKVEPGVAFSQTYEKPNMSDEEWRQLDLERRRRVQSEMAAAQQQAL